MGKPINHQAYQALTPEVPRFIMFSVTEDMK